MNKKNAYKYWKIIISIIIIIFLFTNYTHATGVDTLKIKLYIEGYMDPFNPGYMVPTLANEGIGVSATDVDTITVYLVDSAMVVNDLYNPKNTNGKRPAYTQFWIQDTVANTKGLLQIDGTLHVIVNNVFTGQKYYLAIYQRGMICTWSAFTIKIYDGRAYDFTTNPDSAYDNNEADNGDGTYSFYSGDWNQDENVSAEEFPNYDHDQTYFEYGYYPSTPGDGFTNYPPGVAVLTDDLNGDGNVDYYDYRIYNLNQTTFVFSHHP